ncbi:MAG TPA: GNAT family N-acetyltransferase, partial [Kofleriaceae bacterium]|nr:GNAT family N-acetyltransferase [Kofleriaceae bacterium]
YNAFYGRPSVADDLTRTTWSRLLDPAEPMHVLLAEHEGTVVGLAHFIFHRTTTAITNTCYLQDLFTAPEQRGRGIARALIEAVYARAAAAGAKRVYWQTHESNATAQRLYDRIAERSGFIVYRMMIA